MLTISSENYHYVINFPQKRGKNRMLYFFVKKTPRTTRIDANGCYRIDEPTDRIKWKKCDIFGSEFDFLSTDLRFSAQNKLVFGSFKYLSMQGFHWRFVILVVLLIVFRRLYESLDKFLLLFRYFDAFQFAEISVSDGGNSCDGRLVTCIGHLGSETPRNWKRWSLKRRR